MKVCRRMCRTLRAGMRQYGFFRYFNKCFRAGLAVGKWLILDSDRLC
jgi:hypothetical protein